MIFLSVSHFGLFSLFMPASMLDHAERPHLSKLFVRLC